MNFFSLQTANKCFLSLLLITGTFATLKAQVQNSGTINTGNVASAIGFETQALGNYSFASGYQARANGHYSLALGYQAVADKGNAIAMGYQSTAFGNLSLALGQQCYSNTYGYSIGIKAKANIDNSFAFGRNIENNAINSILIGIGSGDFPLVNNYPNSIVLAVNVTEPTFVIKGPLFPNGSKGKVGIGTSEPVARFQVADGDIFIQDIEKGIIMKSPDGNCWRGTLNNFGQLEFIQLLDCINLSVTNQNEPSSSFLIKIFPNPTSNYIDISCSSADCENFKTISLFDSAGNQMLTLPMTSTLTRLSVNNISKGSYVIKFTGKQKSYSDIVIIK